MIVFASDSSGIAPFAVFSPTHWTTLGVLAIFNAVFLTWAARTLTAAQGRIVRLTLASLLIALEIGEHAWEMAYNQWDVRTSLPFNLCRIGVFLSALLLVSKRQWLFDLCYFWSIGGSLNALITPTLSVYGFPHFLFFKFFISHDLLLVSVLFLAAVEGMRPSWRSVARSLAVTHAYALAVMAFDFAMDANYLYLKSNPGGATLLAPFGDWPRYLPALWAMMVAGIFLLYIPYAIKDAVSSRNRGNY